MMAFAVFHGYAHRMSASRKHCSAAIAGGCHNPSVIIKQRVLQYPGHYWLLLYLCIVLFDGAWTAIPAPTVPSTAANGTRMQ
jgi:hypothetical protein